MAPASPTSEFQYRANRIASFTNGTKIGNTKALKFWTNSTLGPDHLADCGFHYTPTKTYPDQVTCFWCNKKERNLDNVTSISEFHLNNWPKCPYSRIVSNLEQFVKDSNKEKFWVRLRDTDAPVSVTEPHSISSISLRLATFKNLWKFDNKRRSEVKVTSRGLAEAGFYYSPVDPDDDRVICMYCDCPLSDWALDDDPMAEHEKNSFVFCYFLHTLKQQDTSDGQETAMLSPADKKKELQTEHAEVVLDSDTHHKAVPDIDLNEEPVADSDVNSSVSLAEMKPHTSFDAFDFSIEELERNDNATIFHDHDILPKRFTRKRKNELLDEHQKKKSATEKSAPNSDHSTSLALTVREHIDADEPQVSMEDMDVYEQSDGTNISVIESTFVSSASAHEVLDPEDVDYTESSATGADLIDSDKIQSKAKGKKRGAQPKKQTKSQFSDDEFDLNSHDLDAILNSPKKSRKMKTLKQSDVSPLSAGIFDISNQNIGDYDEQNLSYLEGVTRVKKDKLVKSHAVVHQISHVEPELKANSASLEANKRAGNSIDTTAVEKHSPKAIDIDPSSGNSPGINEMGELDLVPQSSPKEASLDLEIVDRPEATPSKENTFDKQEPPVDVLHTEPDASLHAAPNGNTSVQENDRENVVDHESIQEQEIKDAESKQTSNGSTSATIPGISATVANDFSANEATEPGKTPEHELDSEAISKEILDDENESSTKADMVASGSRPSSREGEERFKELEFSPSSYEEYKKDLQMMQSELLETSSPPRADDMEIVEDINPDADDHDLNHSKDVQAKQQIPETVEAELVTKDVSIINETASEDPGEISYHASLLAAEKPIDRPDSVSARTNDGSNEAPGGHAEAVVASSPQKDTAMPELKETPAKGNTQSSPAGFFSKFVERVKAISPSRSYYVPPGSSTNDHSEDYHEKIKGEKLDRLSFSNIEASTPDSKSSSSKAKTSVSDSILPPINLQRALQEIQVLGETIEYLVEVSGTEQELHNDMEGVLTEFVAAMPEEEEAMSISEWIRHNAVTCRRTIDEIAQNIIQSYMDEFDRVIQYVEQVDTID